MLEGQNNQQTRRPDGPFEVAPNLAPPAGNPRFPLLDSLRAVAALTVFAGHVVIATHPAAQDPTVFREAVSVADEGVAIFFVISGFLLYRPFLSARRDGRRYSLTDYARRRVLRIVPAYWAALGVLLLAGLVSGVTASNWWIFFGFGQVYSFNTIGQGIGVAWTLCIEVTFYLALPIFALAAARLARGRDALSGDLALLVVLSAASLAFRAHYSANFFDFWKISTLPGTFLWFALGMGLAIASVAREARPHASRLVRLTIRQPTILWGVAVLLVVLSDRFDDATGWGATAGFVLRGAGALFVLLPGVFGDTAGGFARRILRIPALSWVGLVSYAVYLYHPTVIEQVMKLAVDEHLPHPTAGVLAVSLLGSCGCAAASYYLLERPVMRIRGLTSLANWRRGFREPPATPDRAATVPRPADVDESGQNLEKVTAE